MNKVHNIDDNNNINMNKNKIDKQIEEQRNRYNNIKKEKI